MDLDNIKKSWQETEIKPIVNEDKIQRMISNEGQGAYNKLLKHEKNGFWALIVCIPIGYLLFKQYLPVVILYITAVIFGLFWQFYKIKKLKMIHLDKMSITEVSKNIYLYRKNIFKEFTIGAIWFFAFFIVLGYCKISERTDESSIISIGIIIASVIGFIGVLLTYKLLYWNNIKKLETSIKEVEEFEKDN